MLAWQRAANVVISPIGKVSPELKHLCGTLPKLKSTHMENHVSAPRYLFQVRKIPLITLTQC